jgi:hypothetical protein
MHIDAFLSAPTLPIFSTVFRKIVGNSAKLLTKTLISLLTDQAFYYLSPIELEN